MSRVINEKITPGLSLWIGIDPLGTSCRAEKTFTVGRQEYDSLSPLITTESIYDLASLH